MSVFASILRMFAVLLLPEGTMCEPDSQAEADYRLEADAGVAAPVRDEVKSARIRARRTDMDRDEGVIMFEDDVFVEYSTDYTMNAERLFVFFKGSNTLSRIVATGGVAFTNDTRTGSCAMAVFRNLERRIEMYGGENSPARLVERSGECAEVVGSKITFWIETEQVEVIAPELSLEERNVR